MEEEIDLGKYLAVLIRRWWVVVGVTLVCALAAGTLVASRPKVYKAHAFVALTQPTWQVSFGTAITSPSESAISAADPKRRLASLVALVPNPAVAEAVLRSVGEKLPASERNVRTLLGMVKGELVKDSDLIDITVTYRDSSIAIAIANAWGQEYARQADALYGVISQESLIVHNQVQAAKASYEQAQAALEEALAQSRFEELNGRIAEYQAVLDGLRGARGALMARLLSEISRLQSLREDALAMRAQVQAGGQAAAESNAPALVLLKARAFANTEGELPLWEQALQPSRWVTPTISLGLLPVQITPPTLQIQNAPLTVTAETMVGDLDALAATLERREHALKEELRSLAESLARGEESVFFVGAQFPESDRQEETVDLNTQLATAIRDLEQRVRELRAQLVQEENRLKEAQAQRDLAWQGYDNLMRKEAELAITAQVTGPQVRLVAPAAFAEERANVTKTVAAGAVGGLLLGIVAAYALESWQAHRACAKTNAGN